MSNQANIAFIKSFNEKDLNLLGKESQITYKDLKSDTEDFSDFSILEMIPEMEQTLEAWVKTAKQVEAKKEVDKPAPAKMPTAKKVSTPARTRTTATPQAPKAKAEFRSGDYLRKPAMYPEDVVDYMLVMQVFKNEPYSLNKNQTDVVYSYGTENFMGKKITYTDYQIEAEKIVKSSLSVFQKAKVKYQKSITPKNNDAKKEKTLATKQAELNVLKDKVMANAKFKDKLANELTKHMNVTGLGAEKVPFSKKSLDEKIKFINEQIKFYKNLLTGDKADFKAIGKRIGLDYRKSKPKAKKPTPVPMQALEGLGKAKPKAKKIKPKRKKTLLQRFSKWLEI